MSFRGHRSRNGQGHTSSGPSDIGKRRRPLEFDSLAKPIGRTGLDFVPHPNHGTNRQEGEHADKPTGMASVCSVSQENTSSLRVLGAIVAQDPIGKLQLPT